MRGADQNVPFLFLFNFFPLLHPPLLMSLKTFTREEVTRHNVEGDLWIIIDASVYDMSRFVDMHPGGAFPILELAGKDATDDFYGLHRQDVLVKYDRYRIGTIANEQPQIEFYKSGEMSKVPYAESSAWMGFKSPYFKLVLLLFLFKTHD